MSATKSRKPRKAVTQKQVAPKPSEDRGAAISAGMKELLEVRTKARAKRNGMPAKPLIFNEWFKALLARKPFDLASIAKQYPDVKPTTISSWVAGWRNNNGVGPGYPSTAKGKEKQIAAALKKAAVS